MCPYCYVIVTDRLALSVSLSVTVLSPAKTVQPLFGLRKHVLHGCTLAQLGEYNEPSMRVGDAAFLSNYFDRLLAWLLATNEYSLKPRE